MNTLLRKTSLMMVLAFGALVTACSTTAPLINADAFTISSSHFREIRKEPWEVIGTTNYRVILEHDKKIINVIGRESQKEDAKDNYDARTRKPDEEWFPGIEGTVKIHIGFLKRYIAVRGVLFETAYQYPDYAIRASGHSLGGTWTQLFLLDAILHWPERDIQALFYAPGNPWRRLPKKYREELEKRTVFVCNHWDPVTWMRLIGFYRYGHNIKIGKWWRCLPSQHRGLQMIRALDEKFPIEQKEE